MLRPRSKRRSRQSGRRSAPRRSWRQPRHPHEQQWAAWAMPRRTRRSASGTRRREGAGLRCSCYRSGLCPSCLLSTLHLAVTVVSILRIAAKLALLCTHEGASTDELLKATNEKLLARFPPHRDARRMSAPPPLDTGTHCALASCGTSDFLPLTCAACSRAFCREHAAPSAHDCPAGPDNAVLPAADLVKHAGNYGPELRELLPDRDRVKRASEAVQVSDEERVKRARQQSALDKLRQAAEAKKDTAQTPPKPAAAVKKVSPVLELARLKGRAVPADPKHVKRAGDVAMADRHFLTVRYARSAGDAGEDTQDVWVARVRPPLPRLRSALCNHLQHWSHTDDLTCVDYHRGEGARPLCGALQGCQREQRDDRCFEGALLFVLCRKLPR